MAIVSRIASFVTLLFAACSVAFPAAYTVRVLGASGTPSIAAGINASGDVALVSGGDAAVWHAGAMRFIEDQPLSRGLAWQALGVDAAGALEAFAIDLDNGRLAVKSDASGSHAFSVSKLNTTFDTLTPQLAGPSGQIAGTYQDFHTGQFGSFVSAGGDLVPFALPGWTAPTPHAINALGWTCGEGTHNGAHAGFLQRGASVYDLGAFFPTALNDLGNLGGGDTVWIGNVVLRIAPLSGVPGAIRLTAMNNLGAVVGMQGVTPFVWSPATGTVNLQESLSTEDDWLLLDVRGINDAGQIAANGRSPHAGSPHALLLSPPGRFTPPGSRP